MRERGRERKREGECERGRVVGVVDNAQEEGAGEITIDYTHAHAHTHNLQLRVGVGNMKR
jgi:hypothetical protein